MKLQLQCRPSLFIKICCFLFFIAAEGAAKNNVKLIPQPNNIEYNKGHFMITPFVKILANGNDAMESAVLFNFWLKQTNGYSLQIVDVCGKNDNCIAISIIPNDTTEQYRLLVNKQNILLEGGTRGVVRGLSTLVQLCYHGLEHKAKIPCLKIFDAPVFQYRGVHLDVCRHFMPKEFVKRYIDLIAFHKMNTFHWHLTDDQGWRIEIKKYPKLTEIGAWRNGSMIGPYRDQKFDTIRYGGFYSQQEIREIVAYASQRQINIIPEIEMPGHAQAALAAYPEYSCTGNVTEVAKGWGVFEDVFCVKDSTFTFLEDILSEVMDMFPSKYIHIGGDECPKERWKACPKCVLVKTSNNLKDEHELQSYFIQRIEKFINSKGRKIIGWDEILEGGLAPNATVMSWRGEEGGIAAAKSGHSAIMTPGSHCYFDHYQGERSAEPLAFGGFTPLEKVYAYQPVPDSLNNTEATYILGAQANLWTEYMYDEKQVEYMLLPRLCALSEVLWTKSVFHDEKAFYSRLLSHQDVLDHFRVNYSTTWMRPVLSISSGKEIPSLKLSLLSKIPQKIETAWDNGSGVTKFKKYHRPLTMKKSGDLLVRSTVKGNSKIIRFPFDFSKSTGATVRLITKGDRSYANPGTTLTDGVLGVYPWTGKHWVGWYGKDAVVQLDLGKEQLVDSIVVVYLHDPVSWIHAPAKITCNDESNGISKVVTPGNQAINKVVIPIGKTMRNIGLFIQSIGKNPVGSAGAGDDGWMFISEIQVF